MSRGGRRRVQDGPERRCIATGESGATDRLIRFVLSPDGHAVPDVAGRLPGRGVWLTAERSLVDKAVRKGLFSRAFRQPVVAEEGLADQLEALLARRLVDVLAMARKAGAAVTGAEKVRARISSGDAAVLVQARDGAPGGKAKLAALARAKGGVTEIGLLDSGEMGLAFGREFAIHAALDAGGFAARASAEAMRLTGLRDAPAPDGNADEEAKLGKTVRGAGLDSVDDSEESHGGGSGTGR